MAPHIDIEFRVMFPSEPGTIFITFVKWIQWFGKSTHTEITDDGKTYLINIVCKRFSRQDTLQQSFRNKITRAGHANVCNNVFVRSIHRAHSASVSAGSNVSALTTTHAPESGMPSATETEQTPHVELEIQSQSPLLHQPREELEARVERLETALRNLQPTNVTNNITNNIIIQNFGCEDTSYLANPTEYLEQTMAGMRLLLKDIFFNNDQKQNHTVRMNLMARTAEVHHNGVWKPLPLPSATNKMIGTCRTYLVQGFDSSIHKENDDIMDFMCSLYKPATTGPLEADITAGLVQRSHAESEQ